MPPSCPRRRIRSALPLVASALLVAAGDAAAAEKSKAPRRAVQLLVLEFMPVGVEPDAARNLTALVAAEVGRYDDIRAVTKREVADLLDAERQRQLLGCGDDNCIAQLAGSLGVDKVLSGQLGRVENAYVLTLHLLDVAAARVEARASRTVPVDSNQLVDSAKSAVTDLIGSRSSSANQPPRLALAPHLVAHRGDAVRLDASRCYDPDGDPLRFRWRQLDGPPAPLEGPQNAVATFAAAEPGLHVFAVQVADGRAPPQEQTVRVEVRELRRFALALGWHQLLSFNRLVEEDASHNVFRNRAPHGPALQFGLRLSERWMLAGEASGSYMHVYPEVEELGVWEYVDVYELGVLVGLRYLVPFEGFRLGGALSVGTSRLFFSARDGGATEDNVRSQQVVGDAAGVLEVPFGERVGLVATAGVRARTGTDRIAPFRDIGFQIARDGFLWGVHWGLGVYARL